MDDLSHSSPSEFSSEDALATAFDSIPSNYDDENVSSERQWRGGPFIPNVTQFIGGDGLRNTISFTEQTLSDDTLLQSVVDETNRYYS